MSSRVICIARVNGSGGEEVGRLVADALGFQLVDEEIIQQAAAAEGISIDELSEVERRSSVLTRLMRGLAISGVADVGMGNAVMYMPDVLAHDPKSLRGLIQKSIHETADRGNVVIVSHAASYALGSGGGTLRVLVTAPNDVRVARVSAAGSLDAKEAAKAIAADDAGRAAYLKEFYGVGHELPTHYDLVLNSESLSAAAIAAVVVSAARAG
ncbi:MAG: cytidylate kinase-like family protein [Actinomycetota bacterium]